MRISLLIVLTLGACTGCYSLSMRNPKAILTQRRTRARRLEVTGVVMATAKNLTTLSESHPKLAEEWHPTKNGALTPEQVVAGSRQKVWWRCLKIPSHEWPAAPVDRTQGGPYFLGSGCPVCSRRPEGSGR